MTIAHAPSEIPHEICGTVELELSADPGMCLGRVKEQLATDAVSAPAADVPGLREVVGQAGRDGIDLKVVVMPANPAVDTMMRDVATAVGEGYPESTVLVLSPSYVGTYSTHFTRAKLEAAEDHAKVGTPVEKTQHFLADVNTPTFPWTVFTVVLLIAVAAATVGTRILQQRAKRAPASQESAPDTDTR